MPQIMSCPCVTADVPWIVILRQAAHCQCGRYLDLHAACSVAITSTFMQLMLWPSSRLSCCLRCRHRLALHAACAVAIASPFMLLALWPSPRLPCNLRCGHRLAFHAACAVAIASPFMLLALWPSPHLPCNLRCGHRLAFHAACTVAAKPARTALADSFRLLRYRKSGAGRTPPAQPSATPSAQPAPLPPALYAHSAHVDSISSPLVPTPPHSGNW